MSDLRRAWAAILIAAGLVAPAVHAATIKVRQTVVARQSMPARYDAAYLDGNDGTPLVWGTIANIQIYVGDSCAFNLRTLGSLTGTNAATATLSKVSGTLPAGCTEGADGITGTATAASAGQTFVWRATDGTPADSNSFAITVIDPPTPITADATAPTVPRKCSGESGTGQVTITCDPSTDPYVSGTAGAGVESYKVYLGGVLAATKAAPSANAQPVLTQHLVGGTNGTVTNTQSGADRLLGFGGAGLLATQDQFIGVGHQVNGNFTASLTINSYTSGVTTHHGGLIVYADPDDASCSGNACAPFFACRIRGSDGKPQVRYRSALGGSAANGTLGAAVSLPYQVRVELTASGYQCLTSSDGNTWTATESPRMLSLGSLPHVMAYCTSGTAGQTAQCDLDQVHITTAAPWSQVVTTATGGSWSVSAVDAVTPTANESAQGTAFTVVPTAAACTGDPDPDVLLDDNFDSSPSNTTVWVSGTSYTQGVVRKSPATERDYYCKDTCSGTTDPSANSQWVMAADTSKWTLTCTGYDSYAPSQDSCPTPSTLRARSGARALRTQLTYHRGGTAIPALWVSGTTYAIGNEVASPANYRRYTRKTNGAGTTDPRDDATNWERTYWYEKGDYCSGSLSTCTGSMAHRSELSMIAPAGGIHIGDDLWYGFSTFVPASGDANGDPALDLSAMQSYLYPWQLHDDPDPTEVSRNPPLWLSLYGPATAEPGNIGSIDPYVSGVDPTYWRLGGWWDADAIQTNRTYDGGYGAGDALGTWKTADQGRWVDWVIHYRPHYLGAEGITEVWKDGVKVYSYSGANSPNDQNAPYLKMGIYTRNWDAADLIPRDWPKQTVYYTDAVRVVRTNETTRIVGSTNTCAYQEVAPTGTSH